MLLQSMVGLFLIYLKLQAAQCIDLIFHMKKAAWVIKPSGILWSNSDNARNTENATNFLKVLTSSQVQKKLIIYISNMCSLWRYIILTMLIMHIVEECSREMVAQTDWVILP